MLNYQSERVKDILNQKSMLYSNPDSVKPLRAANVTIETKMQMKPLEYPSLLPEIIDRMEEAKSACYGFKHFSEKRFKNSKEFVNDKQEESSKEIGNVIG